MSSSNIFKGIDVKQFSKPIWIESELMKNSRIEEEAKKDILSKKEKHNAIKKVQDFEIEFDQKKKSLLDGLEKKEKEFNERMILSKKEAEEWSLSKIKNANELYESKLKEIESEISNRIKKADIEAESIVARARENVSNIEKEAYKKGYDKGFSDGYGSGKNEINHLINRLGIITSGIIHKRDVLIKDLEAQIVDIIVLIARKIVKKITKDNEKIIYDNVMYSLRLLKGRTQISVYVNSEDLPILTKYKEEFISSIETIENFKILEDSSVERGGCYISTEFGEIDARISTQLMEIEEQIKRIKPIQEEL